MSWYILLLLLKWLPGIKDSERGAKYVNTLRRRRNGQDFADDIFKHIFFNENVWIAIEISLKFVPRGQINNIPALVQIMAWCRPGDTETLLVCLVVHIFMTVLHTTKQTLEYNVCFRVYSNITLRAKYNGSLYRLVSYFMWKSGALYDRAWGNKGRQWHGHINVQMV